MDPNGDGVGHFQAKSPLTNFQTLTHQISLLADFAHFEQPYSPQNSKTTYFAPFKYFSIYLKFQIILAEVSLIESCENYSVNNLMTTRSPTCSPQFHSTLIWLDRPTSSIVHSNIRTLARLILELKDGNDRRCVLHFFGKPVKAIIVVISIFKYCKLQSKLSNTFLEDQIEVALHRFNIISVIRRLIRTT